MTKCKKIFLILLMSLTCILFTASPFIASAEQVEGNIYQTQTFNVSARFFTYNSSTNVYNYVTTFTNVSHTFRFDITDNHNPVVYVNRTMTGMAPISLTFAINDFTNLNYADVSSTHTGIFVYYFPYNPTGLDIYYHIPLTCEISYIPNFSNVNFSATQGAMCYKFDFSNVGDISFYIPVAPNDDTFKSLEQFISLGTSSSDTNYQSIYNAGVEQGKKIAYNQAYENGYADGYEDGVETADNGSFVALFASIFDGLLGIFYSIFDVEILGLNMLSLVRYILTFIVVWSLVKLFKGD